MELLIAEEWKDINGCKHKYQISNFGRFRICDPFFKNKNSPIIGSKDVYGYLRVFLVLDDGKNKTKKMHRLVAQYFLPDFNETLTVNHKDFNKTNNHISNLEMVSSAENVIHYQDNIIQPKSSSKVRGIGFHSGINKWTCRATIKGERYSLGTFDTEKEAIEARDKFIENPESMKPIIGRGASLIGKSKYSYEDKKAAILLSYQIGVRKAGKETGMGSSGITVLRRQVKEGTFKLS